MKENFMNKKQLIIIAISAIMLLNLITLCSCSSYNNNGKYNKKCVVSKMKELNNKYGIEFFYSRNTLKDNHIKDKTNDFVLSKNYEKMGEALEKIEKILNRFSDKLFDKIYSDPYQEGRVFGIALCDDFSNVYTRPSTVSQNQYNKYVNRISANLENEIIGTNEDDVMKIIFYDVNKNEVEQNIVTNICAVIEGDIYGNEFEKLRREIYELNANEKSEAHERYENNEIGIGEGWGNLNPSDFEYIFDANLQSEINLKISYPYDTEENADNVYFVNDKYQINRGYEIIFMLADLISTDEDGELPAAYNCPHVRAKAKHICQRLDELCDSVDENAYWNRWFKD